MLPLHSAKRGAAAPMAAVAAAVEQVNVRTTEDSVPEEKKKGGERQTEEALRWHREVHGVDLRQPVLAQVARMEHAAFGRWVHGVAADGSRAPPIIDVGFSMPLLGAPAWFDDWFTHTPWFIVPLLWLPVAALLVWRAASVHDAPTLASLVGSGVALWSLFEYCFHRFVYHWMPPAALGGAGRVAHMLLHGIHHVTPRDRTRLVAPPLLAAAIAAALFGAPALMVRRVGSDALWALFLALLAGFDIGYVTYDLVHYHLHHGRDAEQRWPAPLRWCSRHLRSNHNAHHTSSEVCFGVTSPLHDYIFGTYTP